MDVQVMSGNSKEFAARVANAKRLHGKFDPATKTWRIPTEMVKCIGGVDALKLRGLMPVGMMSRPTHKHDHNCPANFGGACECQ